MRLLHSSYFMLGNFLLLPVWGYYNPRNDRWSTPSDTGRFILDCLFQTKRGRTWSKRRWVCSGWWRPRRPQSCCCPEGESSAKNKMFIHFLCVPWKFPFFFATSVLMFDNYCKLAFLSGKNYCWSCYWPVVALSSSPATEPLCKTYKSVFLLK